VWLWFHRDQATQQKKNTKNGVRHKWATASGQGPGCRPHPPLRRLQEHSTRERGLSSPLPHPRLNNAGAPPNTTTRTDQGRCSSLQAGSPRARAPFQAPGSLSAPAARLQRGQGGNTARPASCSHPTAMSLKELKRLAPWQWESKIATKKHKIGPKGLEEWEQVRRGRQRRVLCCFCAARARADTQRACPATAPRRFNAPSWRPTQRWLPLALQRALLR
jgi:hypothetical protein